MRVWTVSEVKAGTLTQCLGVAQHIDNTPHMVVVEGRIPRWRRGFLSPYRSLSRPEPEIVISCGSMAPMHVMAIAAACRNRPMTVHLQTPPATLAACYDMSFISRHDWTEAKAKMPGFQPMLGVPHRVTQASLQQLRPRARQRWVKNGRRAVTVLVGGPNGAYRFDEPTIERLLAAIQKCAAEGWIVLISTSRRSPPSMLERLLLLRSEKIVVWDRQGDNPYLEYLAAADAFLVTKDSITMACEAVASGYPVYVFDLDKTPCQKLEEFEWFHKDMSVTLGLTRSFQGDLAVYDYTPPDEARRISQRVREAFSARKPRVETR